MTSSPQIVILRLLAAIAVLSLHVIAQSSPGTSQSPLPAPALSPETICPGLTEFNSDDNNIPQSATFLDLTFQCVNDTDNPGQAFTYSWVKPTSTIRIEPGDRIAFFSTPADVYRVDSFRDDEVFLVQAEYYGGGGGGDNNVPPQPPPAFALTITFPPDQLQRVRISGATAGDANVVIAPGFVELRDLDATMEGGGLDGILSAAGTVSLRLRGDAYGGIRLQAASANETANDETTELIVDVENGAEDIQIQGTILNGTVYAVDIPYRSGTVVLGGDILDSVTATGDGPGRLLAIDCANVVVGNCTPLMDDEELDGPDVVETCEFSPGCLTKSISKVDPADTGAPLLSCSNLDVLECATPTDSPSTAPFSSAMPSVAVAPPVPPPTGGSPPSSNASSARTVPPVGYGMLILMSVRWGCTILALW